VATLFVIKGKDQGRKHELKLKINSLGRDNSNDVQLNDAEVSRRHAEVVIDDGQFVIRDLQSANGTIVNAQHVTSQPLKTGDHLQLGGSVMIFTNADDQSDISEVVDIVGKPGDTSKSRIIKSITQEEGSRLLDGREPESPWLARARGNLQVMYRTALAVSHTLDIDQLLHRIMELIFEWVDCDRGCVMLFDQDTEQLTPKVSRTRKTLPSDQRILISRTILDYVLTHKEGVLTSDARDDDRWDPGGSIVKLGVTEAVCVPMQGRYGVVGVIYIDTFTPPGGTVKMKNKFSSEHLKLMVAIGHQAALAVEDTSYYSAMVDAERLAAVGQTIATLSHHIKNILQGIRGGSYLIEEGLKSQNSDVVRRGWNIVDKNQEKISNLVMDMLTFSKEREPELIPSDLNEIIGDVVELMQTRADEAEVALNWAPASEMPLMTFDPDGIHRAALNILTNAIDACRKVENAAVDVSTEYDPDASKLRAIIHDNGEGIAPDDLEKIFRPFESNKGNRGTGLGLPVSQKILQEHGGEIYVESTPQGGSTFRLEFIAIEPEERDISRDTIMPE